MSLETSNVDVYLVRKDSDRVCFATLSKAHAIKLAEQVVAETVSSTKQQKTWRGYPKSAKVDHHARGAKGKIYYARITQEVDQGAGLAPYTSVLAEFWVQKHQLVGSPLALLAEVAE